MSAAPNIEGVITPALQFVGVAVAMALWLFAVRRVAQDPRLHPQARQGMSYAVLLMPLLALVYWATGSGGRTPFWLQPLEGSENAVPAKPEL